MSYENAPATTMIATHCAVCGRPLLDAESVERGIGPDCARRYGYGAAQGAPDWARVAALGLDEMLQEDPRAFANALVHRIALDQRGEHVTKYVACLDALGFGKLAARIAERVATVVTVEVEGDAFVVESPFSTVWNEEVRRISGQRFEKRPNGNKKPRAVRVVPVSSRAQLWEAIRNAYGPGTVVVGNRLAIVA